MDLMMAGEAGDPAVGSARRFVRGRDGGWGCGGGLVRLGREEGSGREGGHVYGCGWAGGGERGPPVECAVRPLECAIGSLAWIYRWFSRHSNVSAWIFAARSTDFGYIYGVEMRHIRHFSVQGFL